MRSGQKSLRHVIHHVPGRDVEGHGGSEVAIKSNGQTIEFVVEDTGHFQNFKPRLLGHFEFESPGMYNVDIRPIKKAKVAIMDVRLMELSLRK